MRAFLFLVCVIVCAKYAHICHRNEKEWERNIDAPGNMPGILNGNLAHAGRCLFGPLVGCLPSARHCSQVNGFLKSNLPLDVFARNCVRGKVRSHTWHVSGFAAASLDLCSFNCRYLEGCPLGRVGEHSLHFIFISTLVR